MPLEHEGFQTGCCYLHRMAMCWKAAKRFMLKQDSVIKGRTKVQRLL